MNIRPFRLIDGDLALGEYAISNTPEDVFRFALSSEMERHKAINWLTGGGVVSEGHFNVRASVLTAFSLES